MDSLLIVYELYNVCNEKYIYGSFNDMSERNKKLRKEKIYIPNGDKIEEEEKRTWFTMLVLLRFRNQRGLVVEGNFSVSR